MRVRQWSSGVPATACCDGCAAAQAPRQHQVPAAHPARHPHALRAQVAPVPPLQPRLWRRLLVRERLRRRVSQRRPVARSSRRGARARWTGSCSTARTAATSRCCLGLRLTTCAMRCPPQRRSKVSPTPRGHVAGCFAHVERVCHVRVSRVACRLPRVVPCVWCLCVGMTCGWGGSAGW